MAFVTCGICVYFHNKFSKFIRPNFFIKTLKCIDLDSPIDEVVNLRILILLYIYIYIIIMYIYY